MTASLLTAARPRFLLRCSFCSAALLAGCAEPSTGQAFEATTEYTALTPGADAQVAVDWNRIAYEVAYAEDTFLTFKGQRALALMNLAMHDALNTITPRYDRYAYRGAVHAADARFAAAQAAHDVLLAVYPNVVGRLDSLLAWHAREVAPREHDEAAALGAAAAAALLRLRAADGWDNAGAYTFRTGAGAYQTTPDFQGFVLQPGFRHARPFALRSSRAFRPPPPPPLQSTAYARAFDEVKAFGARESAARTSDQSAYAIWWLEFAEGSVNRLARRLVVERSLGLWPATRMLARLHVALYDGYIATWDAKYEYNHWRPFTAIRVSDDGNARTSSDADWQSLLPAPPFPEYVSAHATACAAAFGILSSVWPEAQPFTMTTITAPPEMPERRFANFADAAAECADSRVRLGWHFRYSTDAGLRLGERVAGHVIDTQLRARN